MRVTAFVGRFTMMKRSVDYVHLVWLDASGWITLCGCHSEVCAFHWIYLCRFHFVDALLVEAQ